MPCLICPAAHVGRASAARARPVPKSSTTRRTDVRQRSRSRQTVRGTRIRAAAPDRVARRTGLRPPDRLVADRLRMGSAASRSRVPAGKYRPDQRPVPGPCGEPVRELPRPLAQTGAAGHALVRGRLRRRPVRAPDPGARSGVLRTLRRRCDSRRARGDPRLDVRHPVLPDAFPPRPGGHGVCCLVLGGVEREYSFFNHGGLVPWYVLAVLSCIRCGRGVSIDRLLRSARGRPVPPADRPAAECGWARYAVWTTVAMVYLMAGLGKLYGSGSGWVAADNVRAHLLRPNLKLPYSGEGVLFSLLQAPDLLFVLLGAAAIGAQLAFGLVLVSRRARLGMPAAMMFITRRDLAPDGRSVRRPHAAAAVLRLAAVAAGRGTMAARTTRARRPRGPLRPRRRPSAT